MLFDIFMGVLGTLVELCSLVDGVHCWGEVIVEHCDDIIIVKRSVFSDSEVTVYLLSFRPHAMDQSTNLNVSRFGRRFCCDAVARETLRQTGQLPGWEKSKLSGGLKPIPCFRLLTGP